jgi:hypothetical protein
MRFARSLGVVATLAVVLVSLGALLSLATATITGEFAAASVVVLLLAIGAVAAAVRLGSRSPRWLDSGGYW